MEIIEMLWQVPLSERLIGIVTWRDSVYVATDAGLYRVTDDGRDVQQVRFREMSK